jgi:putative peptidoglycan lipid II flippase
VTLPAEDVRAQTPERSAALVAGLTAGGRAMGLVRTVVVTAVLGVTYLGNTYASANAVPNLLFEVVAGGALAAAVIPALAGPLARGERKEVERTANALANTVLLLLTPIVAVCLLLRGPLMAFLTSSVADAGVRAAERRLGELLLLFFLPQIWLYGIGVVLTGVLHAHHRFAGPALAPLLSSVVVTASYLVYGAVEGPRAGNLEAISGAGKVILGLGTTAGVAVLSLSLLVPARRLGLRWRPVVRVPVEAARTARRLAGSAVLAVGAQQALMTIVIVLANAVEGGLVAYQLAFTVLLVPWAILGVPVATASYPGMASAVARGDGALFARRCARAARSVALLLFGGGALLLATAAPLSRLVLDLGVGRSGSSRLLSLAVAAFAPGLVGYGANALLARVAYARGDGRSPALAALVGFGSAAVLNLVAPVLVHGPVLVAALAGGFSVGMILGSAFLAVRLRKAAGADLFAEVGPALVRGLTAALVAAAAGAGTSALLPGGGFVRDAVACLASGVVTAGGYLGVQRLLGDPDLRRALQMVRGRP